MATAAVTSKNGLIAARLALGVVQASWIPTVMEVNELTNLLIFLNFIDTVISSNGKPAPSEFLYLFDTVTATTTTTTTTNDNNNNGK